MKKFPFAFLALLAPLAFATVTTQPVIIPHVSFVDNSGLACAGCNLYTYIAGTTTPQATYTDAGGGSSNTNPIVLDASGSANIWIGLTAYKFVMKDASGSTLWTVDNVVSLASLSCRYSNSIAYGCTGATTSQGAATNIVDGNTIKPASILNANVNGICTVTKYGAVGDCAGSGSTGACTNNHDAIQAAIDACYITRGSVYFPTNPSQSGQTVYYTATAINPKGVSMYGPPGASGPFSSYPASSGVGVRGAPSQDVFNVLDPTNGSYVAPRDSFTVQDLAIFVDDSVDASASFPTRKPGRTCKDVVANGTAIITSAAQCEFQPGDAGQNIKVGSTTTTISSWQSATQVTLATTITTGTGITSYISAMNLPVTSTIGNCGFAMDDSTGIGSVFTAKSVFRNLLIHNAVGPGNNTCGFFFQANTAPTWTRWEDVSVAQTTYGFAFVPASSVAPSGTIYTGIADYNLFDHIFINASYPLVAYSPELQEIRNLQIFSPNGTGPQFIDAYGTVAHVNTLKFDMPEMEASGSCLAAPIGFRIAGVNHHIANFSPGTCANGIIQWDARSSQVDNLLFSSASGLTFNLTGGMNTFYQPDGADNFAAMTKNITGSGNVFQTGTQWNPYDGQQPAREQYAHPGLSGFAASPYANASVARGSKAFNRTHDFLDKGGAAYYFNGEDLWIIPDETSGLGTSPTLADDAASPTLRNFQIPGPGNLYIYTVNDAYQYIGSQIPAGKIRAMVSLRAPSATNVTIYLDALESAVWTHISSCSPNAIGTTYSTYVCDGDATGLSGDQFRIRLLNDTAAAYSGWVGIRPYDSSPYGNYTSTLAHNIVAIWNGASGTLVDDNEGGSGYESGAAGGGGAGAPNISKAASKKPAAAADDEDRVSVTVKCLSGTWQNLTTLGGNREGTIGRTSSPMALLPKQSVPAVAVHWGRGSLYGVAHHTMMIGSQGGR